MGDVSRLYPILVSDRQDRDESERLRQLPPHWKSLGTTVLNRLSTSFRSSFRKIKSLKVKNGRRMLCSGRGPSSKSEEGATSCGQDCSDDYNSLDSGLESCDCSCELESSVANSSVAAKKSTPSCDNTIDSGIYCARTAHHSTGAGCLKHTGQDRLSGPLSACSGDSAGKGYRTVGNRKRPPRSQPPDSHADLSDCCSTFPDASEDDSTSRNLSNVSDLRRSSSTPKRISPSCLVTRKNLSRENVPKKKVSILLPAKSEGRGRGSLYGPHLQLTKVSYYDKAAYPPSESVGYQSTSIFLKAREELIRRQPELCDTILLIFTSRLADRLGRMSVEETADLIFRLRAVLFKGLADVPYADVSLFALQLFLIRVCSAISATYFYNRFVDLVARCEKYCYREFSFWLTETQQLYIQFWCKLIEDV